MIRGGLARFRGLRPFCQLGACLSESSRTLAGYESGVPHQPQLEAQRVWTTSDVEAPVSSAVKALTAFRDWDEDSVDALLLDVAQTVADAAGTLAENNVAQTGMGTVEDKVVKIRFASLDVYRSLAGHRAAGLLSHNPRTGVTEYAVPVGVVLGVIPITNPVSTLVFKTLIALKGRNALVASCSRTTVDVGRQTAALIREVLARHGAPADLIQVLPSSDRAMVSALMVHPDVSLVLATGGTSVVKAAYSSGTPAIGVGPGNAPAYIAADADLGRAAALIVKSKSFDNGIVCGSEHNLVVDRACYSQAVDALIAAGAAILDPRQVSDLGGALFTEQGELRKEFIGRPTATLCEAAGLALSPSPAILVAPVPRTSVVGPWGREKLAPVLSLLVTDGVDDALQICKQILAQQGRGHTVIVHSEKVPLAERFAAALDASRVLWNSGGSQGCIGLGNGLPPSLTLGCGTFGGTSTTDNVSYRHLLNIKRLATPLPASEQSWALPTAVRQGQPCILTEQPRDHSRSPAASCANNDQLDLGGWGGRSAARVGGR